MVSRATTQLVKKYYLELSEFFGINDEYYREKWFNELIELREDNSDFTKKENIAMFIYRKATITGLYPITMNKVMRSGIRKRHLLSASYDLDRIKMLPPEISYDNIVQNLFISICKILEIPTSIYNELNFFENKLDRPKYVLELAFWCILITDVYLTKTGFMEIPRSKFHEISGMSGTSYVLKNRELFSNQPKIEEAMQCLIETRLK